MLVNREEFLKLLDSASAGLSDKEVLEQSNSFVFKAGALVTFNDEVMVRAKCPLDFDGVVIASDLVKVLTKFPDDEVDISLKGSEVIVKGRRRSAGLAIASEIKLPLDAVPMPTKWAKLPEGVMGVLWQASRTCGKDVTQYLTVCVHVTPTRVEACDNYRMFRAEGPTGFTKELLIPASIVQAVEGTGVTKVSVGEGWCHFQSDVLVVSGRCSHEKYHDGVDLLLKVKDPEAVTLPDNLGDIVSRAEVMNENGYDARISVEIADGELNITSRKDTGWFKERKKIDYSGSPLKFDINPQFLVQILKRTHDVVVGSGRMKVEVDNIQFVVGLAEEAAVVEAAEGSEE